MADQRKIGYLTLWDSVSKTGTVRPEDRKQDFRIDVKSIAVYDLLPDLLRDLLLAKPTDNINNFEQGQPVIYYLAPIKGKDIPIEVTASKRADWNAQTIPWWFCRDYCPQGNQTDSQ
ncbi:hypothetical protein Q7P35_002921 [Cladosporium inversicolor]